MPLDPSKLSPCGLALASAPLDQVDIVMSDTALVVAVFTAHDVRGQARYVQVAFLHQHHLGYVDRARRFAHDHVDFGDVLRHSCSLSYQAPSSYRVASGRYEAQELRC